MKLMSGSCPITRAVTLTVAACLLWAAGLRAAEPASSETARVLEEVRRAPRSAVLRQARLGALLASVGAVRVHRQPLPDAEGENRWAVLPGRDPERGLIVVGAHTDSAPGSPGVVDDWSGCVMLAALYESLAATEPAHTFVFVGFGGEEHGLIGSTRFLEGPVRAWDRPVVAMINLECLGVRELRSWRNRSADELERALAAAGAAAGGSVRSEALFGYVADSVPFAEAGIPAMTVHSLEPQDLARINGPADDGRLLDPLRYRAAHRVLHRFLLRLDKRRAPVAPRDRHRDLLPDDGALAMAPVAGESAGSGAAEATGPEPAFADGAEETATP